MIEVGVQPGRAPFSAPDGADALLDAGLAELAAGAEVFVRRLATPVYWSRLGR
jgi:hypothetical protein